VGAPANENHAPEPIVRLLLVEDDPMIGTSVRRGLEEAGFNVDWARDGRAAELAVASAVYQAVVLDLGLPQKDGLEVLKSARAAGNDVPVLVVTARDALADRVGGLNSGADDYVLKPFDMQELVARVHALIRRHAGSGQPQLVHAGLVVDPLQRSVHLHGSQVDLSAREFAILLALMRKPGAVLSRDALEEVVYGWDQEVGSNAIEVHLHHLRRKLGADLIKNIRGVGYRIAGT
jgi:two-component system response regulator QseB